MHLNNIIPGIKSHSCQNYHHCFLVYSNQYLVTVTVTSAICIHFTAFTKSFSHPHPPNVSDYSIHRITFLEALNTL